jgi:phytoene synthase
MSTAASVATLIPSPTGDTWTLLRSHIYCENLARREASNFYHAFRVLSNRQRRAMCALYAFLRVADDLSDGPGSLADRRAALTSWRRGLELAMTGRYTHPLHPAFHQTVAGCKIPLTYIEAVLDGVAMDLESVQYETFGQLERYCYLVASAVGLSCIHIWGFTDARALHFAEKAGIALQLTNILRDLGEDAARGRVYLPREDLERFRYSADDLRRGMRGEQFRALMRFQVERARGFYDAAQPLAHFLKPQGRAIFWIMIGTYRGLLDAIESRDYDVFSSRVSLSTWRKLLLAIRALPYRWGWGGG